MNIKTSVWYLIPGLITAVAATALQAQQSNQPGPGPNREGQGPAGAMGRFTPGYERLMGVLTEEQRASMRTAMEEQREKVRGLEEKLREARREMLEAGLTKKFDEDAVRAKALETAKLEAEMTVLRVKAFSQMRPPLSADQIEKIKNAPPLRGENRDEPPRRRPDIKRDENGLPLKDRPATEKPPQP